VKVLYCEDVADHTSPESCGGNGNIAAEALTGESVGGTLSSEITVFLVPTLCLNGEGNIDHSVIASYGRDLAES
jgi:RNA-directed DNA polymerase